MTSKTEYFRNQFAIKKNNYRQNFEIVTGRIKNIFNNKLVIELPKNRIGECLVHNISDYPIRKLSDKFSIGQDIDIAIIGKESNGRCVLNYKMVHPKEIKFKVKAIPTASHYRLLSKQLNYWINEALVKKQKNKKRGI